jgi:hypothetical protein
MGLHKLTAGDGYTYLTRQVAAHDATERGHVSLGDYYDEKGESPGAGWARGSTVSALPQETRSPRSRAAGTSQVSGSTSVRDRCTRTSATAPPLRARPRRDRSRPAH